MSISTEPTAATVATARIVVLLLLAWPFVIACVGMLVGEEVLRPVALAVLALVAAFVGSLSLPRATVVVYGQVLHRAPWWRGLAALLLLSAVACTQVLAFVWAAGGWTP